MCPLRRPKERSRRSSVTRRKMSVVQEVPMRVSNTQVQGADVSTAKKTANAAKTEAGDKAARAAKAATAGATDGAKAEISAKGKDFARAREVAENTPEIREAKIAELK